MMPGISAFAGSVTGDTVANDSLFRDDIGDRAVTDREQSSPIFTAAVDSDGTVSTAQSVGVDQSLTRKIDGLLIRAWFPFVQERPRHG